MCIYKKKKLRLKKYILKKLNFILKCFVALEGNLSTKIPHIKKT